MKPVRKSYEEISESRGLVCYFCGKPFAFGQPTVKAKVERKERDVHARCKTRNDKIEADFGR